MFIFIYGVLSYVLFLGTYFYFIAFVGGIVVPKTVDNGTITSPLLALVINVLLISLFAIQHSVMARESFKKYWTRIIPESMERSTNVLSSSLFLMLLIWQWRPMPGIIWSVENTIGVILLYSLFGAGFGIAVLSSFFINHFELFGLQQVYREFRQRTFTDPPFQLPWLYKIVRHPLQSGQILGLWAIPLMTVGHLTLALGMTIYIVIGVYFEEKDLRRNFGQRYEDYANEVPKLIPGFKMAKEQS